jgi:hypothetical protein
MKEWQVIWRTVPPPTVGTVTLRPEGSIAMGGLSRDGEAHYPFRQFPWPFHENGTWNEEYQDLVNVEETLRLNIKEIIRYERSLLEV